MKAVSIIFFMLYVQVCVFSQQKTPESTEIYSPVPPIVTPGQGTKPPSDAIVLFEGTNFNEWQSAGGGDVEWTLADGCMTVKPKSGNIKTKRHFGDCQLHVEWRTPVETPANERGFGNSGILLQGRYELQVFDSYEYPVYVNGKPIYVNGQAGSIYKQAIPLVNACKKQGEWQVYDIIYIAPRFSETERVIIPARITVLHNGILILNNFEIQGTIAYIGAPEYKAHDLKEPLSLQEHDDPVSYRNIWIRDL
ncbi:MAG: DUF1080 domain-containing protein [Bacteroidales bacterium]|nr:DUF1080 domain-containing protein [Bacteroidales bacterium]